MTRPALAARLGTAAVLAVLVVLCVLPGVPARAGVSDPGVMWGAYVTDGGGRSIEQQESLIGRTYAMDHRFYEFGRWDAFPLMLEAAASDQAAGRVPLWNISRREHQPRWAGYWARLAAGEYDGYLAGLADTLKQVQTPVYLIWQHEPENNAKEPYPQGTPAEYVAAWRHLRSVLDGHGVTNVSYVWTLMAITFRKGTHEEWWPGRQVADVIGADGYNWACSVEFGNGEPGCGTAYEWRSFDAIFAATNAFAVSKKLPWLVGETATAEDPDQPGRKAAWLDALAGRARAWPRLIAINWFTGGMNAAFFDPASSESALESYVEIGQRPYFGRRG